MRRKVRTPGFLLQLENPDRLVVTVRKLQTYRKLPISGNGQQLHAERKVSDCRSSDYHPTDT